MCNLMVNRSLRPFYQPCIVNLRCPAQGSNPCFLGMSAFVHGRLMDTSLSKRVQLELVQFMISFRCNKPDNYMGGTRASCIFN